MKIDYDHMIDTVYDNLVQELDARNLKYSKKLLYIRTTEYIETIIEDNPEFV